MRSISHDQFIDLINQIDEKAFEEDRHADKRTLLVRKLLDNREEYAVHWLTFWNDALRNAYRGTGFIDDGRRQITGWLFRSLYENKPYDRFVHELISPVEGSEGFVKGLKWRGTVNASQLKEMQAAQSLSQVFLGINMKCASCHDSFINDWKLSDSYGLAGVFAEGPLEIHECNKPSGEISQVKFLFPELGDIDVNASRQERMKQLADLLTSPKNGRFSRTIVNRLWAWFYGRGMVEPVDAMDNEPFNSDLLDWLAADLVAHKYDLKHTMELICTSRAYQSQTVGAPKSGETEFVFRGPFVKRMTAEQFVDAMGTLTGVWQTVTPQMLKKDGRGQGGQLAVVREFLAAQKAEYIPKKKNRVRASLAMTDPLMRSLGRPSREQVVTRRDSWATMLQTLELTNGVTLDGILKQGAIRWMKTSETDSKKLVNAIYQTALGRKPTPDERTTAMEIVGTPTTAEGVQDLLWIITMLPEFQLIY
ncbi:MAG: DUF1553 domain-containing protein [Planctomycetes bacterium]|nr:DUF1553 domain-containing protein [Planctomycetota bacterium]